mmetsp:Transcript_30537/g.76622  ORF Transcript_30537/g.76622 Transcript_30537/m.76622 type:complete len:1394 (+) Transcript_30537:59-4240(+)
MEQSAALLKAWILSAFTPHLVVFSSTDADELCLKNAAVPAVKLLQACNFPERSCTARSLGEQTHILAHLPLRLLSEPELKQALNVGNVSPHDLNNLNTRLADFVSQRAPSPQQRYGKYQVTGKDDALTLQHDCRQNDLTPWYSAYVQKFLETISISDHSYFEHPLGCFLVASSAEPNLEESFEKMFNPQSPPPYMKDVFDPFAFIIRIVLHESSQESSVDVDGEVGRLKSKYGSSGVHLIKLTNCNTDVLGTPVDDLAATAAGTSARIRKEEAGKIRAFLTDVVVRMVVPHLEKMLRSLNDQLVARKGFRNQVKAWFRPFGGSKDKRAEKDTGEGSPLAFSHRQLADYAFILQDYDLAHTNYKAAAKEFQTEKQYAKHSLAAYEMAALALYMLESSRKDAEADLDKVFSGYHKLGSSGDQLYRLMSSTFFLGEMHRSRGNFADASAVFIRASELTACDDLCAALLQEQAAFCYVLSSPPMFRKFAFRLSLSGAHYRKFNQVEHALGCYTSVLAMYEKTRWDKFNDHVRLVVTQLNYQLGNHELACSHMHRLLLTSTAPPWNHGSYLREYLSYLKVMGRRDDHVLMDLPLPLIDNDKVNVFLNDIGNDVQDFDSSMEWREMEEDLTTGHVRKRRRRTTHLNTNREQVAAVGESIHVEVTVRNPLQIPVQLTHVQLSCEHISPSGTVTLSEVSKDGSELQDPLYKSTPFALLLAPNATQKVKFTLTPLKQGRLVIKSFVCCLCGEVFGKRDFALKPRRLNSTKAQRKGVVYEESMCLSIRVCPPMPLMTVDIPSFPTALRCGQVVHLMVHLKNIGNLALQNVRVKLSHPSFFVFCPLHHSREGKFSQPAEGEVVMLQERGDDGEGEDEEAKRQPLPEPVLPHRFTDSSKFKVARDISIINLKVAKLDKGDELSLVLHMRPDRTGTHSFKFLFSYEPSVGHKFLEHRFARATARTTVHPSLTVQPRPHQSAVALSSFLLGLDIANNMHTTTRPPARADEQPRAAAVPPRAFPVDSAPSLHLPSGGPSPSPSPRKSFAAPAQQPAADQPPPLDISITQVTLISNLWSLQHFSMGQASESCAQTDLFDIRPSHTSSIFFRVLEDKPAAGTKADTSLKHCSVLCNPSSFLIDTNKPPYYEFLIRENIVKQHSERDDFLFDPAGDAADRHGEAAAFDKISLMVFWEGADGCRGVSNISNLPLHPSEDVAQSTMVLPSHALRRSTASASMPSLPAARGHARPHAAPPPGDALAAPHLPLQVDPHPDRYVRNILHYRVECLTSVTHDFSSEGFCVVPIVLQLKNMSPVETLAIQFSAVKASIGSAAIPDIKFFWCGPTTASVPRLPPFQETSLVSSACFPHAGVFDLNVFRLTVECLLSGCRYEVAPTSQHLIAVKSQDEVG